MSDEPYAICEGCRQPIDPEAAETVRAVEIVDLGPTSGRPHSYAEGMPTVFHESCFPEGSSRFRRRDSDD